MFNAAALWYPGGDRDGFLCGSDHLGGGETINLTLCHCFHFHFNVNTLRRLVDTLETVLECSSVQKNNNEMTCCSSHIYILFSIFACSCFCVSNVLTWYLRVKCLRKCKPWSVHLEGWSEGRIHARTHRADAPRVPWIWTCTAGHSCIILHGKDVSVICSSW